MTHSLFPIELNGGNQRLLNHAIDKQRFEFNSAAAYAPAVSENHLTCDAIIGHWTLTARERQARPAVGEHKPKKRNQTLTAEAKSNPFAWTRW